MPASLPLQLLKISPKTLFVLKAFKFKHSLRDYSWLRGRAMRSNGAAMASFPQRNMDEGNITGITCRT